MKFLKNIINLLKQIKKNIIFIYQASQGLNLNYIQTTKFIFSYKKNFFLNIIYNYIYKKEKKEFLNFIKSFRFTNDWFSNNVPVWISILKKKDKNEKLKILEIGSYEGMSAIFFLKFFNNAEIDCVETFKGSDEHAKKNFELVKKKL